MSKFKKFFTEKIHSPEFNLGYAASFAIADVSFGFHRILTPGWGDFLWGLAFLAVGLIFVVRAVEYTRWLIADDAERVGNEVLREVVDAMNELQEYNQEHVFERKGGNK